MSKFFLVSLLVIAVLACPATLALAQPTDQCPPPIPPNEPPIEIDQPFDPLVACGPPEDAQTFAQCVVSKITGPPIVLPNPWLEHPEAQEIYDQFCAALSKTMAILERTAEGNPVLLETLAFLRSVTSVVQSVRVQLQKAKDTDDCRQLQGLLEGGVCPHDCAALLEGTPVGGGHAQADGETTELIPSLGDQGAFPGALSSPFLPLPPFTNYSSRAPPETIVAGAVERGGSYLVFKEAFGLKLRLWYTWIPIWVEPWYSRRRIIGRRLVWHLRWVPCEYLKTIAHNVGNTVPSLATAPTISAVEFCDSRLLSYWRWFPRGFKPLH